MPRLTTMHGRKGVSKKHTTSHPCSVWLFGEHQATQCAQQWDLLSALRRYNDIELICSVDWRSKSAALRVVRIPYVGHDAIEHNARMLLHRSDVLRAQISSGFLCSLLRTSPMFSDSPTKNATRCGVGADNPTHTVHKNTTSINDCKILFQ